MGFGPNWRGVGLHTHEAFSVPRLTVGVSNEVQMTRNLTGGLPVVNQGRLASLGPIRKCLNPTHERKVEMATGGERSARMKNGRACSVDLEMNLPMAAMQPASRRTSLIRLGASICSIALILSGLASIPCCDTKNPRSLPDGTPRHTYQGSA